MQESRAVGVGDQVIFVVCLLESADRILYHVLIQLIGNKKPRTLVERNKRLRNGAKEPIANTLIQEQQYLENLLSLAPPHSNAHLSTQLPVVE